MKSGHFLGFTGSIRPVFEFELESKPASCPGMPRSRCPHCQSKSIQKRGHYFVQVLKSYRRRYFCNGCKRSFSSQTLKSTYRQKRPDLNHAISTLLLNGMAQRQIARVLGCSKNTVDLRIPWFRRNLGMSSKFRAATPTPDIVFIDEMESIEHTKLKPLTIPLAVGSDYRILAMTVGKIGAKGLLADISKKKYGHRQNEKQAALKKLFSSLKMTLRHSPKVIRTDKSPFYQKLVKENFPHSKHETYSSRDHVRKKKEMLFLNHEKRVYDPLFPLNQRCAKLRQDIKRLSRRSWCTTKDPKNLETILNLYISNQVLRV